MQLQLLISTANKRHLKKCVSKLSEITAGSRANVALVSSATVAAHADSQLASTGAKKQTALLGGRAPYTAAPLMLS